MTPVKAILSPCKKRIGLKKMTLIYKSSPFKRMTIEELEEKETNSAREIEIES